MKDKNFADESIPQMSKVTEEYTWDNSVVKVVFKDEQFVKKYKLQIEQFFKQLLDEGDNFVTEHEFEKLDQSFHIDNDQNVHNECNTKKCIPFYSTIYEDVLHCREIVVEESNVEHNKPQTMTCFNCLGDHHMKDCLEKLDRMRIAANKKNLMPGNTIRYHEEERKNAIKPGYPSDELRTALGIRKDQLPRYIYNMRIIGYPPGWMQEAEFETSGISLYGSEDESSLNESRDVLNGKKQYDSEKFINYQGFNTAVPDALKDEWKTLGMPPIQQHQLLSEALKSENTMNSKNMYKRKHFPSMSSEETKKSRNGENSIIESDSNWSPARSSTPKLKIPDSQVDQNAFESPISHKRLSLSLSKSPGTPIIGHGNPFRKLPGADKFAQDITEHLPFENLPDAVGKFENMRNIINNVQKALQDINRS